MQGTECYLPLENYRIGAMAIQSSDSERTAETLGSQGRFENLAAKWCPAFEGTLFFLRQKNPERGPQLFSSFQSPPK